MADMPNYLADLQEVIGDEQVEACVIGPHGGWEWRSKPAGDDGHLSPGEPRYISPHLRNTPLPWDDATKALLDYEYDDGYGGVDCHPVWIWTPTRVILIRCYDGSTGVESVPRNPQPGKPDAIGGG